MNFTCDRCEKRYTTSEEAVPGRTYRIPCDCGNTIVVDIADPAQAAPHPGPRHPYTTPPGMYRFTRGAPDPFAPPVEGEPVADDPFARALSQGGGGGESSAPSPDVTPAFAGPFARRDPDAPSEESAEYRITGSLTFDDVLRRVRRQGFAAGAAAGAVAGAVVAGLLALLSSMTTATTPGAPPEAAPPLVAAPGPAPAAGAAPAASAVPAGPGPAAVAGPRRAADVPAPAPERPARVPRAVAREPAVRSVPQPTGGEPSPAGAATENEPLAAARSEAVDRPPAAGEPEPAPGAEPGEPAEPASPAEVAAPEPADPTPSRTTAARVDERQVAAALRARRPALDACVASMPGDAAAARGRRFFLRVVVEPDGKVSEAQVDDPEIDATPLGVCLMRVARDMSFASFEGEPVRVELALQYGESD